MTQTWDELRDGDTPKRKLTVTQAEDVRRTYAAGGVSLAQLGRRYGMSATSVMDIVHRRHYVAEVWAPAHTGVSGRTVPSRSQVGMSLAGWLSQQGRAWHRDPRDRTTNRWRYGSYRPAYIWDDDNADDPALAA